MRRAGYVAAGIVIAVGGAAFGVAACFLDTSDLAAGGTDSGLSESEGGAADGATPSGDGAAPAYCAPSASLLFCDDFGSGPFGGGWENVNAFETWAAFDTNVFQSPPRSLRAKLETKRPAPLSAYLQRKVSLASNANLRVELAFRWGKVDSVTPVGLVFQNDFNIGFRPHRNAIHTQRTGQTFKEHPWQGSFPTAKWTHVRMDVRRSEGTITVYLDESEVLPATPLEDNGDVAGPTCSVRVGSFYAAENTTWDFQIDDIRVSTF